MTYRFLLKSAHVLLLTSLVLVATQTAHANSLVPDIIIDGEFEDWSDGDGTEICQIDENGATDVNILYEYEFSGGVPIERRGYYWDINKQCASPNPETGRLSFLQAAYRELSVPYDWDTYDRQTVCTFINTDPNNDDNYNYALCTDIYISYCDGPNPSCSEEIEKLVQLMSCNDSSSTLCGNANVIRTYNNSAYANDVGDQMTFQVWVGGQLRSFFDDMTEIEIRFNHINISATSEICINTGAMIYQSDTQVRDTVLNSGNDFCFEMGGVPTSVELSNQYVETAGLASSALLASVTLIMLAATSVITRRKE